MNETRGYKHFVNNVILATKLLSGSKKYKIVLAMFGLGLPILILVFYMVAVLISIAPMEAWFPIQVCKIWVSILVSLAIAGLNTAFVFIKERKIDAPSAQVLTEFQSFLTEWVNKPRGFLGPQLLFPIKDSILPALFLIFILTFIGLSFLAGI